MPSLTEFKNMKQMVQYLRAQNYVVDVHRRLWNFPTNEFDTRNFTYFEEPIKRNKGYDRERAGHVTRLLEEYHFFQYTRWLRPRDVRQSKPETPVEQILDYLRSLGYTVHELYGARQIYFPAVPRGRSYVPKTRKESEMIVRLVRYFRFWVDQHRPLVEQADPTTRRRSNLGAVLDSCLDPIARHLRGRSDVVQSQASFRRRRAVYVAPRRRRR